MILLATCNAFRNITRRNYCFQLHSEAHSEASQTKKTELFINIVYTFDFILLILLIIFSKSFFLGF